MGLLGVDDSFVPCGAFLVVSLGVMRDRLTVHSAFRIGGEYDARTTLFFAAVLSKFLYLLAAASFRFQSPLFMIAASLLFFQA